MLVYDQEVDEDFGCVLSKTEFIEDVENGMFMDCDGYGYPVKGNKACRSLKIYPSRIKDIPEDVDFIIWFNK